MVNEDIRMRNWDGTQVRRKGEAQWHKPNQEEIEMIQEYERNEEEEEALLLTAAEEEEIQKETEDWEKEILQSVLKGNWEALKKPKITRHWTGKLLQGEQSEGNMIIRFESVFAKDSVDKVAAELGQMWEEQLRRCKNKSWEPFDEEEIQQAMDKWKRGKATRPDRVSQEALMRLAQGGEGIRVMTEELSDWLYRGKVTTEVSDSVTVLLKFYSLKFMNRGAGVIPGRSRCLPLSSYWLRSSSWDAPMRSSPTRCPGNLPDQANDLLTLSSS